MCGEIGGTGVDQRGHRRSLARCDARREQGPNDARQDIAGSGCGSPGLAGGIEIRGATSLGDDGDIAFQQDGGIEAVGEFAGGGDPSKQAGWGTPEATTLTVRAACAARAAISSARTRPLSSTGAKGAPSAVPWTSTRL